MKTRKVSKSVYICENCGAEYSKRDKIEVDRTYGTNQEFCPNCSKKVMLADTAIFDVKYISDDLGCKYVDVPSSVLTATELDLEYDYADYKMQIVRAMELYGSLVREIEKQYMAGKTNKMKQIPTNAEDILK